MYPSYLNVGEKVDIKTLEFGLSLALNWGFMKHIMGRHIFTFSVAYIPTRS